MNAPESAARVKIPALFAGPLVAIITTFLMSNQTTASWAACLTAGVALWMAVWWMTEAIPLAATALLPLVTFPMLAVYTDRYEPGQQVIVRGSNENAPQGPWSGALVSRAEDGSWAVKSDAEGDVFQCSLDSLELRKNQLKDALTPYANKFVFLFLGGFMIAQSIQRWGLHRRMALHILLRVGSSPRRLVAGFMIATALMSMWLSNTATTIVMLPVAISLISQFRRQAGSEGNEQESNRFAICLMLAIAYAATIGGICTLIGTPPNALLASQMEKLGTPIPFVTWMIAVTPMSVVFLVLTWLILVRVLFPLKQTEIEGGATYLRAELDELGPTSKPEWVTCAVFASVALLWILRTPLSNWQGLVLQVPWVGRLDDSIIAVAGAIMLFVIPVSFRPLTFALDWEHARKIPWEILLLFGGGIALSEAINDSGLGQWLGATVTGQRGGSQIVLVSLVVLTVIFLTEFSSNLATAALFLPLLAAIAPQIVLASGSGISPGALMIPTALAASCAFMLPVATPPNAIVFGSGCLKIRDMIRAGVGLNLLGVVLITIWTLTLGQWVLKF